MVSPSVQASRRTTDKFVATTVLSTATGATAIGVVLGSRLALLGVIGAAVPLIYLFLRNRGRLDRQSQSSNRFLTVTSTFFFALLGVSAVLLRSGLTGYERSVVHFACIAFAFGVLAVQSVGP